MTWEGRYDEASRELAEAQDALHRFYVLDEVAKAAFEIGKPDEAATFARETLDLAQHFQDDWNYGNAIHDGHMVLGRVALRNGEELRGSRMPRNLRTTKKLSDPYDRP